MLYLVFLSTKRPFLSCRKQSPFTCNYSFSRCLRWHFDSECSHTKTPRANEFILQQHPELRAPALLLHVLTSGLQRGGAHCSSWVSLILEILWNPSHSLRWCFWMCVHFVCDYTHMWIYIHKTTVKNLLVNSFFLSCMFAICILILWVTARNTPQWNTILLKESFTSLMKLRQKDQIHESSITVYAALLSDKGVWGPCYILKMQYETVWQEWQFPELSESCETKLLQHSQGQEDHYSLLLWTLNERRTGEKHTSTTLTRIKHMSNNISQEGNFWKKTGTSCFSLKQMMWSPPRLGWPGHLLILYSCNPQLQCRRAHPPGESMSEVQDCGLTYLMFIHRPFKGNGSCIIKVTDAVLWWWTNMHLYRCIGTSYRNKKPGILFSHFWAQLIDV